MNEKKYKSVVAIWGVIFLTLQALSMIKFPLELSAVTDKIRAPCKV